MLYEHIVKLQKELELKEPLGKEGQESYSLLLDDTTISIIDQPPGFQLKALLGPLPSQKVEEFLTHMLRGNLFGQATHQAFLGLDETGTHVILQFSRTQATNYREFLTAIEDFINTVDFWKKEISSHPSPT